MSNNSSALIQQQISESLRESSPLFVSFLETYYQYLGQRNKAVGLVQSKFEDVDIDLTLDIYINKFFKIYAEYIPTGIAMDKRNFIKLMNSIYEAKGTEKAVKLLFKTLFNEVIDVTYPSANILKASDGIWIATSYITVTPEFGSIPLTENFQFDVSNDSGDYYLHINKVERIPNSDQIRLYFNSYSQISITEEQLGYVRDDDRNLLFAGRIIISPNYLEIIHPGKFWQKGQVVSIPGNGKNTVARITSVDKLGAIRNLEILEHGYIHDQSQTTILTPFKNKPMSSQFDMNSLLVSTNPDIYHHSIAINELIDPFDETVFGYKDSTTENSYFGDDYVLLGYSGTVVLSGNYISIKNTDEIQDFGISLEDYVNSKTTLKYVETYIVKTRGEYKNEQGQLSHQNMKLQDNYFYQAFSYLLATRRDISEYKNVLKIIHPAGMKFFTNIQKEVELNSPIISNRTISNDTLFVLEIVHSGVAMEKVLEKGLIFETVTQSDALTLNNSKSFSDSSSFNHTNSTTYTVDQFDSEVYFGERYMQKNSTLTIG